MNEQMYLNQSNCYTYKQVNLMNTFRKLWEQHIMWTRLFIISTVAGADDLPLVTKRLLRNPDDFANELKKFYGNAKANEFAGLFEEHLLIAAKLVNDAKAGNTAAVEQERKKWYANADEIAAFLASINPYWSQREWKIMLYDHLKMTEYEAIQQLNHQYNESIMGFDHIEEQALLMADVMSKGIIKQFRV